VNIGRPKQLQPGRLRMKNPCDETQSVQEAVVIDVKVDYIGIGKFGRKAGDS
jgi:hypothetical protein